VTVGPRSDARPDAAWWHDAVVYQVYVRSFADADGDGIGDLDGIRSRLDHLSALGVDAIWLNPCYPSPQRDHGYDVADYCAIEPAYGDLATFDQLVADAAARGIRVLMDVVPNHCSTEHPWFRAAVAAAPGSPERGRFFFRDGVGDEPPNNWRAVFGGSAWTRVADGQWYLGTFSPDQPDWDHTHPDVVDHFEQVLRFWFDRGVEGFRVDAVPPVGKAPELPDQPPGPPGATDEELALSNPFSTFRPEGHAVWRRWRRLTDRYVDEHPGRDIVLVAEAYTPRRPDLLLEYARPDEFHQAFAFDALLSPWRAPELRQAVGDQLMLLHDEGVVPTWTLSNHDVQRTVTRLGRANAADASSYTGSALRYVDAPVDLDLGRRRALAAIAFVLALPGSVYLFQGEELGLPEWLDLPDAARQDPVFLRTGGAFRGRDGCRVPLPWTADRAGAHGFSPPDSATSPWLPQPDDWGRYAVDVQALDPTSPLATYRSLLAARRRYATGSDARLVDLHPDLVAIRRGRLIAVLNPTAEPVHVGDLFRIADVVVTTVPAHLPGTVPADSTVWVTAATG
jgi:alpha-glucosidase